MLKWETPKDYTKEEALIEANRCLSCKNPLCQTGCPAGIKIRDFIFQIKENQLEKANEIIACNSNLSNICSIVCPHENQCVGHCVLGKKGTPIQVGKLERFVQNYTETKYQTQSKNHKKIAIIGAGPAGLSAAKELLIHGCDVDIYEKESRAGGVMTFGIPKYRLDYKDVLKIVEEINNLGGKFIYNKKMLESNILALKDFYDAIFISIGLSKVRKLGIENENLSGVYDALDFLKQTNLFTKFNEGSLPDLYGTVVVVGAGNVAMDAARSAVRLGAEHVLVAYRRSMEEAPATKHEIEEALNEGVKFKFLTNPVEIIGQDKVSKIKCEIMTLSELDSSGRRKPVGTGTYTEIPCDFVISAIGQIPEDIYDKKELILDHNYICADHLKTNIDKIYVGGDIYLGAKTVVLAMKTGKDFAEIILNDLSK